MCVDVGREWVYVALVIHAYARRILGPTPDDPSGRRTTLKAQSLTGRSIHTHVRMPLGGRPCPLTKATSILEVTVVVVSFVGSVVRDHLKDQAVTSPTPEGHAHAKPVHHSPGLHS